MAVLTGRRDFLRVAAALPAAGRLWAAAGAKEQAAAVLQRIKAPVFAERDFAITKFGAKAGVSNDSTAALRAAIGACSKAGGGRVVVPEGTWLTGAVHLESNVNLYLAEGAVLKFSKDPRAYLPVVMTRWEGTECMGYSAFIYANGKQNVAVTGKGTLDGQADNQTWWPWKGRTEFGWKKGDPNQLKARDALVEMGETDVPVEKRMFGEGSLLRPQFIQTYRCRNVLVEGVTMVNSPMWEIHPLLSTNVTVRGVKVSSHGPNNDGCDPESSTDVLIDGCTFDTGDDCIAIKSGRNRDGRRVAAPCENIIIRDCLMKDGHGAVTIGSEMSGGVRNVYAYDCRMESPNQDRILRIKTNSVRGGFVENVFVENMTATEVADAIVHIDFFYEEGDKGKFDPVVRKIDVRNFKCSKAKYAFYLRGFERAPIRDVRVTDCVFENVAMADVMENTAGVVMEQVRVNGKEVGR